MGPTGDQGRAGATAVFRPKRRRNRVGPNRQRHRVLLWLNKCWSAVVVSQRQGSV